MAEGGMCSSELQKFGDDHLLCSICYEMYTKPKTLSCLHSFCEKCLLTYAKSAKKNVRCPLCNHLTLIPAGGVNNLPTDFRLGSMTETVLQSQKQAVPTCTTHAGKRCEVYCATCSEIICVTCLTESHNRHDLKEIAVTVAAAKREFIRDFLPMYETSLPKVAESLETVSEMKVDLLKAVEKIRQEIAVTTKREIGRVVAANRRIKDELDHIQTMKENDYAELTKNLLAVKKDLEDAIGYSTGEMQKSDYDFFRRFPEMSRGFRLLADRRHLPRFVRDSSPVIFLPDEDASLGFLLTRVESVKYVSIIDCYNEGAGDGDDEGDDENDSGGDEGGDYGGGDYGGCGDDYETDHNDGCESNTRGRQKTFIGRLSEYLSTALYLSVDLLPSDPVKRSESDLD
ncbi:tripartite motif-containing protein 3-like [Patiria miniata]|uniref:Uncharacterized protein n=1 Tax=Patiria miniata TaxID=46514 RepID=A0A914BBQ6_PATMI|nr:tripartite motif-containing protein 3-like [Patiria miniata]